LARASIAARLKDLVEQLRLFSVGAEPILRQIVRSMVDTGESFCEPALIGIKRRVVVMNGSPIGADPASSRFLTNHFILGRASTTALVL
jgi:hypothetical protein